MLEGIRVIDFSQYIPGSYTSLRLKELGAEVIIVEPIFGSAMRNFGTEEESKDIIFSAYNPNKKSIAINLKDKLGQNIIKELIKKADIIIESFRPGVMDRFGLSYSQVKQIKEDIIYLSMSGYGINNEMSGLGSHDLNYLSLSGVLNYLKDESGKPILPKITYADILGGLSASEKIVSSLFNRERTGNGKYINISLLDEIYPLVRSNIYTKKRIGKDNTIPQLSEDLVSYNIYETKDGRYLSIAALEKKFWQNFCLNVNRSDWIDYHLSSKQESKKVYKEIKELFLSKTLEEWHEFSLNVDCCMTPILQINELEKHPYFRGKELTSFNENAPNIGEHTENVLRDLLDMGEREIKLLQQEGIIK